MVEKIKFKISKKHKCCTYCYEDISKETEIYYDGDGYCWHSTCWEEFKRKMKNIKTLRTR